MIVRVVNLSIIQCSRLLTVVNSYLTFLVLVVLKTVISIGCTPRRR